MEAISSAFNTVDSIAIRDSSYMQFCSYAPRFRRIDREYLQDRHEDGNLITLVKASSEGLILFPDGLPQKVSTVDDEIVVFTGSLLSILSDGRIPTMDHAVVNPTANTGRSSLVYFALPDLQRTYTSFVCGNGINLETTANELHRGFGNQPFRDTAS
jgi:isopenicillin N synthase-like dioxygenase